MQLTCTGVTWTYKGFPEAQGNAVTETIFADHSELSVALAVFDGLTGSHTTPLMQAPGRHQFKVRARWHTNGLIGRFSAHAKINCPAAPSFSVEDLQAVAGGGGYTSSAITAQVGQTVDSQIVVHNTGNVAITLSGLSGARCDAGTLSVPTNPLPVGGSTAYLCSHLVTSADGVAGHYSSAGRRDRHPARRRRGSDQAHRQHADRHGARGRLAHLDDRRPPRQNGNDHHHDHHHVESHAQNRRARIQRPRRAGDLQGPGPAFAAASA